MPVNLNFNVLNELLMSLKNTFFFIVYFIFERYIFSQLNNFTLMISFENK